MIPIRIWNRPSFRQPVSSPSTENPDTEHPSPHSLNIYVGYLYIGTCYIHVIGIRTDDYERDFDKICSPGIVAVSIYKWCTHSLFLLFYLRRTYTYHLTFVRLDNDKTPNIEKLSPPQSAATNTDKNQRIILEHKSPPYFSLQPAKIFQLENIILKTVRLFIKFKYNSCWRGGVRLIFLFSNYTIIIR